MKSLQLITCIIFFSCSSPELKYEYIEKNDTFRNKIDSGYFSLLTHGYTYSVSYTHLTLPTSDLV